MFVVFSQGGFCLPRDTWQSTCVELTKDEHSLWALSGAKSLGFIFHLCRDPHFKKVCSMERNGNISRTRNDKQMKNPSGHRSWFLEGKTIFRNTVKAVISWMRPFPPSAWSPWLHKVQCFSNYRLCGHLYYRCITQLLMLEVEVTACLSIENTDKVQNILLHTNKQLK